MCVCVCVCVSVCTRYVHSCVCVVGMYGYEVIEVYLMPTSFRENLKVPRAIFVVFCAYSFKFLFFVKESDHSSSECN